MVLELVCCSHCHTTEMVKNGKSADGQPRYRRRNPDCARSSFILDYPDLSHVPAVKPPVSDMAMNGSGIRDTARVLRIRSKTVIEALKTTSSLGIGSSERSSTMTTRATSGHGGASGGRDGREVELCPVEAAAARALVRH